MGTVVSFTDGMEVSVEAICAKQAEHFDGQEEYLAWLNRTGIHDSYALRHAFRAGWNAKETSDDLATYKAGYAEGYSDGLNR